jgi:hypothetical protein
MEISELKKKNEYFAKVIGEVSSAVPTNEILFRCSSLGKLMTDPKAKTIYLQAGKEITAARYNKLIEQACGSGDFTQLQYLSTQKEDVKDGDLSESVKTNLVDVWVVNKYERHEEITSKYLDKGNEVEEDSITVVSRMTKQFYKKNAEHLKNDFIKGTPDLFLGQYITQAERIRDTKSSYSIFTFHRAINKELNKDYYWQLLGYMWLTGANVSNVDYCLINTPYHLVENELRRESYNHLNGDTPTWIELQLIAKHTYDRKTFESYIHKRGCFPSTEADHAIVNGFVEVPLNERFFTFEIERNDADIERLKQRIIDCRKWIKENLDTKF